MGSWDQVRREQIDKARTLISVSRHALPVRRLTAQTAENLLMLSCSTSVAFL